MGAKVWRREEEVSRDSSFASAPIPHGAAEKTVNNKPPHHVVPSSPKVGSRAKTTSVTLAVPKAREVLQGLAAASPRAPPPHPSHARQQVAAGRKRQHDVMLEPPGAQEEEAAAGASTSKAACGSKGGLASAPHGKKTSVTQKSPKGGSLYIVYMLYIYCIYTYVYMLNI